MDFALSDQQEAIAQLAGTILGDHCAPDALRALERGDDPLAVGAWKALAGADLLGLAVPEGDGGSGLGLLDACLVAEQVGRHVAPVPYWPSTAAALALARWGSAAQRERLLPGAVDGSVPLAVALWEPLVPGPAAGAPAPAVTARPDGDGWRLDGTKQPVPWAPGAAAVLVPARIAGGAVGGTTDRTDDAVGLFLLDPSDPGVTLVAETAISREPHATLVLDGAAVGGDGLVGPAAAGGEPAAWLAERAAALVCATALGVVEQALALTAAHVTERQQFGVPIGTFQAVAQRAADAYVDTEAIRLTTWQAAWRLDAGLPAGEALAVAGFWVAEGGQRVVHAAQHLHGGIGVDVDYPVHRYFRWAKVLELLLGGPSGSLLRLGASLAAGGPDAP